MSKRKQINKYPIIVVIALALWLGESAYFGWNKTAQSPVESFLDLLSGILLFWGIVGDLLRNVRITKTYNNVTNAKKLTILDQRPNGTTVRNYKVSAKDTK